MALLGVVHCIAIVLGGVMRGLGKSSMATLLVFLSFYLIGQPLGMVYTFVLDMGVTGLIFGFLTGSTTLTFFFYLNLTCFSDWN